MSVTAQRGLLGPSVIMGAGTVVSRITGFARAAMVAAALGLATVTADTFIVPTVIPTTLYILVGGGVLNSVLVPAMVRAIKEDADGGQAYSQRLFSLVVTVLGLATAAAVVAAPWIVRAFVDGSYLTPELRPFFDDMVLFARFCLPQIFFYGVYVLVGQMLNARGRFGPMMWAPILNNLVGISVLAAYLVAFGKNDSQPFTAGEVLLLGLGSTLGVAVQALSLVPVLRRTGFRMRWRTDWRGTGLGQAIRLGGWTVAFVLVNQVAYLLVVKTATGGSAAAALGDPDASGAGASVYTNAMLTMMVPHSVITVSLATALLPRLSDLAVDRNFALVRDRLVSAVRTCLALIVPIAALLAALAGPLAAVLFGYGAAAGDTSELAFTLIALLPGLVAFTTHYMVLRGFYALQDTRTPFFVQLWVSGTMAVAALLIGRAEHPHTTVLLALGYSLAYVVGALVSVGSLGRRLGGIPRWPLVLHILWLFVPAGMGALAAYGLVWLGDDLLDGLPWRFGELVSLAAGSLVGLALFVGLAYLMRIDDVREAVGIIRGRIGRRRPSMDSRGSTGRGADAAADPTPRSTPPGEQ